MVLQAAVHTAPVIFLIVRGCCCLSFIHALRPGRIRRWARYPMTTLNPIGYRLDSDRLINIILSVATNKDLTRLWHSPGSSVSVVDPLDPWHPYDLPSQSLGVSLL
ncbi:hypothetical protein BKA83DRAFT_229516 [Pisolithus microcarpus]|nr:hypothetical protein BKA83DRAFT_229516 [Pisolithus microcarpus]